MTNVATVPSCGRRSTVLSLFADRVARGDAVQAGENSGLRCGFDCAKASRKAPTVAIGTGHSRLVVAKG
jgi:hypothetical protein